MTVYIIQDQKQLTDEGQLVSKFDFEPARRFGELKFVLRPSTSPFLNLPSTIAEMHEVLSEFTDEDYLLLTGNPVLMGLAVAVAADYNEGNLNLLQWSGAKRVYIPIRAVDIFQSSSGQKQE